jgi:ECF transporter S component (folate family)
MFAHQRDADVSFQTIKDFFSWSGIFSLRNTVIMGMLIAVSAVLSRFSVYLSPTMKVISVSYLPGVAAATLFGPWAALTFGLAADTVNFLAQPQGPYFFGYAISEMLTYFIYACFLYRQPFRIWKAAVARMLILICIVFGLNFCWSAMLYGASAGKYFTGLRLLNNLIQFPIHTALVAVVSQFVKKIARRNYASG